MNILNMRVVSVILSMLMISNSSIAANSSAVSLKMSAVENVEFVQNKTFAIDQVTRAKRLGSAIGDFKIQAASNAPDVVADAFVTRYKAQLGVSEMGSLKIGSAKNCENPEGGGFVLKQQIYRGLPIFGAGVNVGVNKAGGVTYVGQNLVSIAPSISVSPKVTQDTARRLALRAVGEKRDVAWEGVLGVYQPEIFGQSKRAAELVWKFELSMPRSMVRSVYVSAIRPQIIRDDVLPRASGDPCGSLAIPTVPRYHLNPVTKIPDFMTFSGGGLHLLNSESQSPEMIALRFFTEYPYTYGTGDVPNQLKVTKVMKDPAKNGMTHVSLQQMLFGYPVFGGVIRVHLNAAKNITSISGTLLRDPLIDLTPKVSESDARDFAISTLISQHGPHYPSIDSSLLSQRLTREARTKGLVVFPGQLNQKQPRRNELSYQFDFPSHRIFVSARDKTLVAAISNRHSADELIYDSLGNGDGLFDTATLVVKNQRLEPGTTPIADINTAVLPFHRLMGFYAGLGWQSYDNSDSTIEMFTNSTLSTDIPCPNAYFNSFWGEMWFCLGMVSPDIMGHEITHGVTANSAELVYLDEPGAVNEHYSDAIAQTFFPDASGPSGSPQPWMIGETSTRGAIRDMRNPVVPTYSAYQRRSGAQCTGFDCDFLNCDYGGVHTNSGIGNRAMVFMSDGDASHASISTPKLGRLFFETLTTRMYPWAHYIDEALNTWQTANDLAASPLQIGDAEGKPISFTQADANSVLWAFTQVGVDVRLTSGWFALESGPSEGTMSFRVGETTPAGINVTDMELNVLILNGNSLIWTGSAKQSTGGAVISPQVSIGNNKKGFVSAKISSAFIGQNKTEARVDYSNTMLYPIRITTTPVLSAPLPAAQLLETPVAVHYSTFGDKGDDTVNAGKMLNGTGCVIRKIELVVLNDDYDVVAVHTMGGPDATSSNWGSTYGGRITSQNLNSANEAVGVHWWHEMWAAMRYKLRYTVEGAGCSL